MDVPLIFTEEATSRFVTANGFKIHYNELGETGQPIIFLHGGGPGCSGWSDFRFNAPTFAAAGYHCYLVDLPMFGKSDKPVVQGGTYTFLAECMAAFMAALGIGRAHYVCQSLGGSIGLMLAINRPELVDHLVFTGSQPVTYGAFEPLRQKTAYGQHNGRDYYGGEGPTPEKMRRLLSNVEWFDPTGLPEDTVKIRYEASVLPDAVRHRMTPGARGESEDMVNAFHLNQAKTLIIWGQGDWFGGLDIPLLMFNRFPDARLYVIQRTSHHLQEERPELYNRLVMDFLREA